jgi:hypothetical protein
VISGCRCLGVNSSSILLALSAVGAALLVWVAGERGATFVFDDCGFDLFVCELCTFEVTALFSGQI